MDMVNPKRGEVYLVRLDPTEGSEIKKTRPALIVSPDELNAHLKTVILETSVERAGVCGFPGAWRRCNSLEWNDHSASLRLALHPENRTLQPVQLSFLG